MRINRITSYVTDATKGLGETILKKKPHCEDLANKLIKINDFVQGESYNPGRGAYYVLMSGFVIAPRLIQAREPDEFREILTRDVITVLTILFAMKGLKSGMCTAAQRNAGITLVQDAVGKNASKFSRLKGYLNPEGGIIALGSDEILARYSNIKDRDSLVKLMKTIDKEDGDLSKMFAIEKQTGFIDKIKDRIPFIKQKPKVPTLYNAAKKMFGGEFEGKTNKELIDIVSNITSDNKVAIEGLEQIVGSNTGVPGVVAKTGSKAVKGILNSDGNPLTNFARNISANFETLSLALTAGFLGFGLPRLNEKMTMKKHLNKPGINPNRASSPEGGCEGLNNQNLNSSRIFSYISTSDNRVFQSFMGNNSK